MCTGVVGWGWGWGKREVGRGGVDTCSARNRHMSPCVGFRRGGGGGSDGKIVCVILEWEVKPQAGWQG